MNLFQVNLFVKSLPEMLRFYRDTLGFEVNDIEPGPPSIPLVNWASLRTGSIVLELFDGATFWDADLLANANRHAAQLCFIVDDVEHDGHDGDGHGHGHDGERHGHDDEQPGGAPLHGAQPPHALGFFADGRRDGAGGSSDRRRLRAAAPVVTPGFAVRS